MVAPDALMPGPVVEVPTRRRVHLDFLDGLRGLAALYVCLYHVIYTEYNQTYSLAALQYGHEAVVVFIVLSGYCLMLPVTRDPGGRLRGGIVSFIRRRARRILVPYYAALLIYPVYMIGVRSAKYLFTGDVNFDFIDKMFGDGSLAAHLFLYLNWRPRWISAIAPAMWSVALEWQIYFVFALLLLPLYRRLGVLASLAVAVLLGLAPTLLLPRGQNFVWTAPWMLGLFAFGMAGAVVNFGAQPASVWALRQVPWGALAWLLLGASLFGTLMPPREWREDARWLTDFLVGGATICLIVSCTRSAHDGAARRPWALWLLERQAVVALGHMSYSLYLTHLPLLAVIGVTLNYSNNAFLHSIWVRSFAVLPALLLGAWAFYHVIERRFSITSSSPPRARPPYPRVADHR